MKLAHTRISILLMLAAMIVMAATFAACGDDDTTPTPPAQEEPDKPNKEEQPKDENEEEEEKDLCDTNYNITKVTFPIHRNAALSNTVTIYPDENNVFRERVFASQNSDGHSYLMPSNLTKLDRKSVV